MQRHWPNPGHGLHEGYSFVLTPIKFQDFYIFIFHFWTTGILGVQNFEQHNKEISTENNVNCSFAES